MADLNESQKDKVREIMSKMDENLKTMTSDLAMLKEYAAGKKVQSLFDSIISLTELLSAARKRMEYTPQGLLQFVTSIPQRASDRDIGEFYQDEIDFKFSRLQRESTINFEGKNDSLIRRFCRSVTKLLQCFGAPEDRNLVAEKFGKNYFFSYKRTEVEDKSINDLLSKISDTNNTIKEAFDELRAINKDVNPDIDEARYISFQHRRR